MRLAKVRGTVVSTVKDESLMGVKLLLIQLIDEAGDLQEDYEVAAEVVGAGGGEWVLVSRGSGARQHQGYGQRPVDAAIIALSRACPFYEGKVAGKAMRTIHYRGSESFAWQGVYTNLPSVGGLMPYAETVENLTQQLFNRYHSWLQAMDLAGVDRQIFLDSGGELLTAGWNPVRLNSVGTVELRNADSNHPQVILALVALISEAANRVRRENITVRPKSGCKVFKLQGQQLNVPEFEYLSNNLLYAAVTEGINNIAVKDYLDSILEFSCQNNSEVSSYLSQIKTTLGEYTTTEAELLSKFSTTTGTISEADGLALVRHCCDRFLEEVNSLKSGHLTKSILTTN